MHFIFCSFEVGGLPFRMAEILNRHGRKTLYASVASSEAGPHDTTRYHFPGMAAPDWDISNRFQHVLRSPRGIVRELARIRAEFEPDGSFATGMLAHLLEAADLPYLYWSYGSDLDQDCFGPVWPEDYPYWKRGLIYPWYALTVRRRMRRSLRQARALCVMPYQRAALDAVAPGKPLFFFSHFLPLLPYDQTLVAQAAAREEVAQHIGPGRYVFSATRHVWSGVLREHSDNKGNDIALRAFHGYLQRTGDPDIRFVTVRKGPDVAESMALAEDLGIAERLVWMEEMNRQNLSTLYLGAELCFGQFGTPVLTFTTLEPMANATPCISYFQAPGMGPYYPVCPPVVNTCDPEEITRELVRILSDPVSREALAYDSWRWVDENCSERRFVETFEASLREHAGPFAGGNTP